MGKTNVFNRPESALRDFIAANLNLIESGLTLVAVEHPLPNSDGAKGYIDILARDVFGHRVVIEIKRSDSTARQALHELHKYVELLQKNQGLSNADVRCILVSTNWHELTVPFGAYQRNAKYPVDGYLAVVIGGRVTTFEKIDPVADPLPIKPFRIHCAFLFMDRKSCTPFSPHLERILAKVGVTSAIVLSMVSKPGRDSVMYPYCLYLLMCDLTSAARSKYRKKALIEAEIEPEDETERDRLFEEQVSLAVTQACKLPLTSTFETSWPEKYAAEREFWDIKKIIRIGRMRDEALITDDDIRNHLLGYTGTGVVAFNGLSSPSFTTGWNVTKERVRRCLVGNEEWLRAANYTFALIEAAPGRATAAFHIYNPCDTVMMLHQIIGNDDHRFIPQMEIFWKSDSEDSRHIVSGVIGWDGKKSPANPRKMNRRIFHGDDTGYFLARLVGEISHFDPKVMRFMGLSYYAAHFVAKHKKDRGFWLVRKKNEIHEVSIEKSGPKPLPEFIEANSRFVIDLVEWFRSNSFGA